jgi:hypothetical protein
VANAALFISDLIEGPHDFLGEFRRLAKNLRQHLARDIAEPRKLTKFAEIQNIVQQKNRVVHRGLVNWHRALQQWLPTLNPRREPSSVVPQELSFTPEP